MNLVSGHLVLLALAAYVVVAIARYVYHKRTMAAALATLPGPPSTWLLGNSGQIAGHVTELYDWKLRQTIAYGATYCLRVDVLTNGSIFTSSAANLEHILSKRHANYIKPPVMETVLRELLGSSIFNINVSHPSWRFQRKLIASLFSVNALKAWTTTTYTKHLASLVQALDTESSSIDLSPLVLSWTTHCIYEMAFGATLDADDMQAMHDLVHEAGELIFYRFTHPWYVLFQWCMPSEFRLHAVMTRINALCNQTITNARATATHESTNVLAELLRRQATDASITDVLIRDMMMGMFLAGRESVGSSILWALYCVATHPHVEAILVDELGTAEISFESIASSVYLDAVVRETLRLFPPVPIELKCAVADDVLPDGTYVPQGAMLEYSAYVMGRDPRRWADADQFQPDRWLSMATRPTAYELPTFNAGVRSCVGQQAALLQTKLVVATLVQRFHLDVLSPKRQDGSLYALGLALLPRGGLHVRARARCSLGLA
ncbi:hypothetical protein SPRG_14487 [Saprolegnia parasitica CBS 223.65]|uniref:Cytochrome P450 n=1 Tax=Saprolegnia parasitica (strain CBS 223.65) TaxID=695850 RepID=A0A067C121_SAPPC|nr:hypothetical protein SPRG_14487 [Saprolegnia parasitica CBS 223.65]KDO20241.1 hypothetical protein SPRG_14487 [Saprolegnia parasitica CBS 223.65]|eukprot:XP_012209053.1 hypothetical protein SPRG_14487 [Saprolegnia parasitica CBS 223.65]